ncbi:hypothetical protein BLNAU_13873 [Blattamonas nauphoetae]|uniref:Transposase n=1 Tax=Blattamonas nauphoetae TaxID=2049346 RepID=A0ABQ9XIQ1_9EUKA|nr:hypothetical protein BLNAU_13873 [Blattamonas nauphoetae]
MDAQHHHNSDVNFRHKHNKVATEGTVVYLASVTQILPSTKGIHSKSNVSEVVETRLAENDRPPRPQPGHVQPQNVSTLEFV